MKERAVNWFARIAVAAAIGLGCAATSFAAEKIKVAAITDPGYHAALWAVLNKKVSDPSVDLTVDMMPIPAMIQASMTQQYDIIPNGVLAIPQMAEAGINPLIIGTMIRHIAGPGNHTTDIWVKADSPIKSIEDLKGKRIAVTSLEAQDVVSRRSVLSEKYGLNASAIGGDFTWVEIPSAQFEAALDAGRVDAVCFSNVLAYKIAQSGKYRSILQGSKDLIEMYGGPMPTVVEMGYKEKMEAKPEAYIAAAKLLRASAEYVLAHQDEVFSDVAPKYNMTAEDLKGWFTTYAGMPFAIGPTDEAVYVKAWQSGQKLGVLAKAPESAASFIWEHAIKE
jgi:NitT/TauT family transport system substrate-binding protein